MGKFNKLEKIIYSKPYNDLTDYGKGVRDLINYLNNSENITQNDILKYI